MKNIREFILKLYRCRKRLLVLLFFFSLVSSFLFLYFLGGLGPAQHGELNTDYRTCYKPFAESIMSGDWVYLRPSPPFPENNICSTPGYPIFLAAVFSLAKFIGIGELELIFFFNIVIIALSTCLLFLIADLLFSRRTSVISSFLWMTYPFNLWFLKNPHTEVPFIFLLLLGVWLFLSSLKKGNYSSVFLSSITLGFNVLIRPIAFFFLPLISLSIFFIAKKEMLKRKVFLTVLFLVVALLPVFLWETAIISKTGGFLFLYSDTGPSVVDGLTFGLRSGAGGDKVVIPSDVLSLMGRAKEENLMTIPQILEFLSKELIANPIAFFKLIGLKILRSWYGTSQMWWEGKILAVQLFYLIPSLFGLGYLVKKHKEKIKETIFLLAIILYFWIMAIAALSILRYMIPAMPFVIIFSAIAIGFLITPAVKKY